MPKHTLPYKETGYFSQLMCDYVSQKEALQSFSGFFPSLENFKQQIAAKEKSFPANQRKILTKQLMLQYQNLRISQATLSNIDLLKESSTFTITTGHQLNLFTGPLYFLYKIFSVINLSEELKEKYPKSNFVPVYWMATEDHDFEEINYFNLFGKKVAWNRSSNGAVGELSTEGLDLVLASLEKKFGTTENAKKLISLFSEAYLKQDNLANATRYLANELFSQYGLVIVDGNDSILKQAFKPYVIKEITKNLSYKKVTETTNKLTNLGYGEQVHPREINLFYLIKGVRERIIEQEGRFYINDTDLSFSNEEILKEIEEYPERFSPNALLRPLYQEVILPNLCYVGGGGELAYWFQLKEYFNTIEIPFPILLLRNSVLLVPSKLSEKLAKLKVTIDDLFIDQYQLETKYTKEISRIEIDFSKQREQLQAQFKELYEIAKSTDASFIGAVGAQEKKQLNGLDNLEKRLLKAQKRKLKDQLERLTNIQDSLFPQQSLQERSVNFSEFYLEYGDRLLQILKENLAPLEHEFSVLEIS